MNNMDKAGGAINLTSAFAMVSHDIKNSLGILLKFIGMIAENCELKQGADMEYEVRRINNNLVKLLTLFKVDEGVYLLNLDAHSVKDFLDEALLEHGVILRQKGIEYEVECDPELFWYFDRNLMMGVMGNAISNALRYTNDRIRLTAEASPRGLAIGVEDNGEGFPDAMLELQNGFMQPESGFLNNNTGLGLYFTQTVLDLHKHDGIHGQVKLANRVEESGGIFSIILP
ncbi:MAG: HAMP domain-containing histidine kinase [Candidatus Thiodiazotropha sp. (ex Ctena orbiculata)]|uniref:histidine kinase n=1 Tax=Candidatus Thiodiazotropha taylori TaxID=2792791 RepID=A0A944M7W6_9GAMM|nr:HAMP domain-containing histidine kinase [Candidatus Thiodiazotropha taylori]MBV2138013.1 HAMP domain-containing histidine kinase [Candidatus Thiodiazotropha taylori]